MKRVLQFLLPLLVLAAGGGALAAFVSTRPAARRAPQPTRATPVEVIPARLEQHSLRVRAQGTVIPARELVLQPELTARVVWRSEQLVPGGLVSAGQVLVRLDGRDYRTALRQNAAQVESARVQVLTEERRRAVAEREWQILARERAATSAEGRELSLREPHIRSARASADATRAQLAQARLTLSRTTLRAPFAAMVRDRNIDLGQLVGPSSRLATLVGTDEFWVQVSLPLDEVASIRVPGVPVRAGEPGSTVRVIHRAGEQRIERAGRVVRLLGDLDPVGRMARVLVEIDDPLGLRSAGADGARGLPLLLGAYVAVEIEAGTLEAIEIPRVALRPGDVVWVMQDGALALRQVEVAWRREDSVLVRGALHEGDAVVVSPLATAVAGLQVRLREASPARSAAAVAPGRHDAGRGQ